MLVTEVKEERRFYSFPPVVKWMLLVFIGLCLVGLGVLIYYLTVNVKKLGKTSDKILPNQVLVF